MTDRRTFRTGGFPTVSTDALLATALGDRHVLWPAGHRAGDRFHPRRELLLLRRRPLHPLVPRALGQPDPRAHPRELLRRRAQPRLRLQLGAPDPDEGLVRPLALALLREAPLASSSGGLPRARLGRRGSGVGADLPHRPPTLPGRESHRGPIAPAVRLRGGRLLAHAAQPLRRSPGLLRHADHRGLARRGVLLPAQPRRRPEARLAASAGQSSPASPMAWRWRPRTTPSSTR